MATEPRAGSDIDLSWAPRMRGAVARYRQAHQRFAQQPQALVRWREMRDALIVLERMSEHDRVPPQMAKGLDHDELWLAFKHARRLCRSELQQLCPLAAVPAPQAVQSLLARLQTLHRRPWPAAVNRWSARLQSNLRVYVVSEADHRRRRIPASLVCTAIAAVLDSLTPPAAGALAGASLPASIVASWQAERDKLVLVRPLNGCRDALLLRRSELAEQAHLLPN